MVNKCVAPSCRSEYAKDEKKQKVDCDILFPIEEYRAKQIMDSIRKPPKLEKNETLYLV